jgi:tetratricopeptide (TPR) repeat protein
MVKGELDWIVMRALEKNRNQRYETANSFAADVQRYLDDEAVQACPPSVRYRFGKFARRNKAAVAAGAALGAIVLLAIVGLAVNNRMVSREKARTEANFQIALDAVDRFFTQVSQSRPLKAHGLEGLRRDLLVTAKEFYEKFIRERSTDPHLRAELARARMRLGFVTDILGSKSEAIALYEQALPELEALAGEHAQQPDFQQNVAEIHNKLGQLFESTGRAERAEAEYGKSRELVERLVEKHPAVSKYRRSLATVHSNLASLYKESGRIPQAEAAYTESQRLIEALLKDQPDDPNLLIVLSYCHYNWGIHYRETNRLKPAETALLEARKIRERLTREHPDIPEARADLANTYHELGVVYWIGKQFKEAEEAYRQAERIRESLCVEHPLVAEYQSHLAALEGDLANLHWVMGQTKPAEDAYARSSAILERLIRENPDTLDYQKHLAIGHGNLGTVYSKTGRPAEAEDAYQNARAIFEQLAVRRPDLLEFANLLGNCETEIGNLRLANGKSQDSLDCYATAIPRLQSVLSQEPRHHFARSSLRNAYWGRSEALSELRRYADALHDRDRAIELDDEQEPAFRLGRISTLLRLSERDRAALETEELLKAASAATIYDLACVYALASKDAVAQAERAERYAARAVELLRQAVQKGYRDLAHLKSDKDLDTLRQRDDFRKLSVELGAPGS